MLPPSDHVPEGYVRFSPDGPLFLREYLAKHPVVEARLRAQAERARRLAVPELLPEPGPPPEPEPEPAKVTQLRAELGAAMRTIRYLRNRVEVLEHQLAQATRIRRVDPAEYERREDVRRHPQAYTAFVLRAILEDLGGPRKG
jgi:hypothetical protein